MFLAKEAAKKELLKEIPENLLTKICISDNSKTIEWEEEGREFRLNGDMYDVVKIKHEAGVPYMFCLADKKEDIVNDALEKLIQSNTDNTSHQGKHHLPVKIAAPDWVFELQVTILPGATAVLAQKEYYTYKDSLLYRFIEINSPPPDLYFKLNKTT